MEPTQQPGASPANFQAETLQVQQPTKPEKPSAEAANKYAGDSNVTVKSLSQSPSSTTPPPPPSLPKPPSPWRTWRLEILFCVVSLGSFISVIAVLRTYDGRSLPDLPMRVTLNTVVAFLTTLTKASFMTFLSESISQLKWNAFHTYPGRPLIDFDLMDRASRGVAGSFSLLRRLKWRHLTSIAALITIVSIVTTPVTQQMISYPSRRVPSSHVVSIPYTREWTYVYDRLYNTDIARAVTTGITKDVEDPIEQVRPNCPTANCTFPPYTSLAVCVQNAEITHLLNVTKIENSTPEEWFGGEAYIAVGLTEPRTAYNVSLPNGFHVVTPSPFTAVQRLGREPIAFADDRDASNYTALAHVFVIYANEGNVTDPAYKPTSAEPGAMWEFRAVETLFHVCVNSYQTEVVAGIPSTSILSSSYAPLLSAEGNQPVQKVHCNTSFEFDATAFGSCPPDEVSADGETTLRDPNDPARGFTLERSRAGSMSQVLQISLPQDIVYTGEWGTPMIFNGPESVAFFTAVYGRNFNISKQEDHMARLELYHNNTAYALTNYIRTHTPNRQDLPGTAWEEETYVSVQWGWSVWLIVELLTSYLLLVATIISTYRKKVPAWKSSVLAVVVAPTTEIQSAVGPMQDPRRGEKNALSVLARLDDGRLHVVD